MSEGIPPLGTVWENWVSHPNPTQLYREQLRRSADPFFDLQAQPTPWKERIQRWIKRYDGRQALAEVEVERDLTPEEKRGLRNRVKFVRWRDLRNIGQLDEANAIIHFANPVAAAETIIFEASALSRA